MKRVFVYLILSIFLLSSCNAGAASSEDKPSQPASSEEAADQTELPETKSPIKEITDPADVIPLEPELVKPFLVTWSVPTAHKPGFPFAFSLPFNKVEMKPEKGKMMVDSREDYNTYVEGSLEGDWRSDQQWPAGYWVAQPDQATDRIEFQVFGPDESIQYEGTIVIERLESIEGITIYGARLEDTKLVMIPSPVGRSAIISTEGIAPSILNALSQLEYQAAEIAAPPWLTQVEPGSRLGMELDTPDGYVTIDSFPEDVIIYHMAFPTNNIYVELGPISLFYDATNQTMIGQQLRE